LEFVKRLKPEHFQSFWYFSSSISFAIIGIFAGILAATSLDEEERKSYIELLAEYRWILRISSTGASVTKHGVSILDANNDFLEHSASTFVTEACTESEVPFSPDTSAVSLASDGWREAPFDIQHLEYGHDANDFDVYGGDAFFTF
jgi:hypothetical protein